jgi:hypothetical protein
VALVAVAFGAGWFLRDRNAAAAEASRERLDVLVNSSFRAGRDRFVLVMLEKERTPELTAVLTSQLAETLTSARQNLGDSSGSVEEIETHFPWSSAILPNVANEYRTAGEYLERKGGYPQAVLDAKWLVNASSGRVEK